MNQSPSTKQTRENPKRVVVLYGADTVGVYPEKAKPTKANAVVNILDRSPESIRAAKAYAAAYNGEVQS